ncbi:MAG: hypothetical protein GY711_01870 [bacterium]|nr:hypothetical protein [bacterium]
MKSSSSQPAPPRILGRYDAGRPGPLFIVIGGLHGNEPAGVEAAQRVVAELARRKLPLAGRVVALSGNRRALAEGRRFIDLDLNRCWTSERIERALTHGQLEAAEDAELVDILGVLEAELAAAAGPPIFLDLHSTSAQGAPFTILADTLQNRAIARYLPIPVIMGLEERIEGPLLSWFADHGSIAVVVEGGAHDDPATVDHHQAAIWLTLVAGGGLAPDAAPEIDAGYRRLKRVGRGLPGIVEVLHGHHLEDGDGFKMRGGYANFQEVVAGEVLANDVRGNVTAPWSGYVLMPLYQGQGEDGFFLCREASRSWLRFSAWARSSGTEALLGNLPGLSPHPRRRHALLADGDIAPAVSWALRLFGYRKHAPEGGRELYLRRPELRR